MKYEQDEEKRREVKDKYLSDKSNHSKERKILSSAKWANGNPFTDEEISTIAIEYAKKYKFRSLPRSGTADECLEEMIIKREWDSQPVKLQGKDYVDAVKKGTFVFRGVSKSEYVESFYNGDLFAGQGLFGNGIYFANNYDYVIRHNNGQTDNTIVCILPNGIKFAGKEEREEHQKFQAEFQKIMDKRLKENWSFEERDLLENAYNMVKDFGKYCLLKGYKGYTAQNGKTFVMLARNELQVGGKNEQTAILDYYK